MQISSKGLQQPQAFESSCTIVDLDPTGRTNLGQWYKGKKIKRYLQRGRCTFTPSFLSQAPFPPSVQTPDPPKTPYPPKTPEPSPT